MLRLFCFLLRAELLVGRLSSELRFARVLASKRPALRDRVVVHDLHPGAGDQIFAVDGLDRKAFDERREARRHATQVAFAANAQ